MKRVEGWSVVAFFAMAMGCGSSGDDLVSLPDEATKPSPNVPDPSGAPPSPDPPGASSTDPPPATATRTLKVLTYNVAGLPQALSSANPAQNTKQISPRLNPFDLVLVQEDFAYHDDLVSVATHSHKTPAMKSLSPTDLGDGLNALARAPVSNLSRTKWKTCSGYFDQKNDCMTSKGFASFVLDLGDGLVVDVYDAHFDAGRSDGDAKARDAQVTQLLDAIATSSKNRAVIVAGDTNMKTSDESTFATLLSKGSLQCSCRTLKCPEAERIDRVMFRSSSSVTIAVKGWQVESFVDAEGKPLSDHEPVSVVLELSKK